MSSASSSSNHVLLITLIAFGIFGYYVFLSLSHFVFFSQTLPNTCTMTYMSPHYHRVSVPYQPYDDKIATGSENTQEEGDASKVYGSRLAYKYRIFRYENGCPRHYETDVSWVPKDNSKPVIFIPGNAGSYEQVRSIAKQVTIEAHKYEDHVLDFFALDFRGEHSALSGVMLYQQAEFFNDAIRVILSKFYPENVNGSVIVVAHSMGGVVARGAMRLPNYRNNSIDTIITLSTPHRRPMITMDRLTSAFYSEMNDRNVQKMLVDGPLFISISGGIRDREMYAPLSSLKGITPSNLTLSMLSGDVKNTHRTIDHRAILWCNELIAALAKTLFAISSGLFEYPDLDSGAVVRIDKRLEESIKILVGDDENVEQQLLRISRNIERGYVDNSEYRSYSHPDQIVTWLVQIIRSRGLHIGAFIFLHLLLIASNRIRKSQASLVHNEIEKHILQSLTSKSEGNDQLTVSPRVPVSATNPIQEIVINDLPLHMIIDLFRYDFLELSMVTKLSAVFLLAGSAISPNMVEKIKHAPYDAFIDISQKGIEVLSLWHAASLVIMIVRLLLLLLSKIFSKICGKRILNLLSVLTRLRLIFLEVFMFASALFCLRSFENLAAADNLKDYITNEIISLSSDFKTLSALLFSITIIVSALSSGISNIIILVLVSSVEEISPLLVTYLLSILSLFPSYLLAIEVISSMSLYRNSVSTKELTELVLCCICLLPIQYHISLIARKISTVSNQTSQSDNSSNVKILDEIWGPFEFYREKKKGVNVAKSQKPTDTSETIKSSKPKSNIINVTFKVLSNMKIARVDDDTEYADEPEIIEFKNGEVVQVDTVKEKHQSINKNPDATDLFSVDDDDDQNGATEKKWNRKLDIRARIITNSSSTLKSLFGKSETSIQALRQGLLIFSWILMMSPNEIWLSQVSSACISLMISVLLPVVDNSSSAAMAGSSDENRSEIERKIEIQVNGKGNQEISRKLISIRSS